MASILVYYLIFRVLMVQVLVFVASAVFSRVRKSGAGPVFSLRLDMRVNCYSVSVWYSR